MLQMIKIFNIGNKRRGREACWRII